LSVREFKPLPTFDAICKRLDEMENCVAAQGNVIEYLLNELQEREFEVTFLMNISSVVIPTSKIAGADGKLPAIRKSAREIYQEEGRAKVVALFQAKAKAELDAENLSPSADAPQESPAAADERKDEAAPLDFTVPGKVTH
jgi:hypothetical protein